MQMCRSSIFSFDTLDTSGFINHGKWIAILTALIVVFVAEGAARFALAPTGEYWEYWNKESADKFLWYRELAVGPDAAEIVIIGDSTAARNFLPSEISKHCEHRITFNLGWPANFPLALQQTTLPLLESPYRAPEIVICSISPKAFTGHPLNQAFEAPILASPFARHQGGETLISDYVMLTRLYSAREFSNSWFTGQGLFEAPKESGAMILDGHDPQSQTSTTVTDQYNRGGFAAQRLAMIDNLREIATRRGFEVILVVPPREYEYRAELEDKYIAIMSAIAKTEGFQLWDLRRVPQLHHEHFFDSGHLNREGAQIFSTILAHKLCGLSDEI